MDAGEVVVGQRHVGGGDVLLEPLGTAGAGDRDDVVALRQQPGERELGDGDLLARGQLLQLLDRAQVGGVVVALPALVQLRMSSAGYSDAGFTSPVRKPRPSGE